MDYPRQDCSGLLIAPLRFAGTTLLYRFYNILFLGRNLAAELGSGCCISLGDPSDCQMSQQLS